MFVQVQASTHQSLVLSLDVGQATYRQTDLFGNHLKSSAILMSSHKLEYNIDEGRLEFYEPEKLC